MQVYYSVRQLADGVNITLGLNNKQVNYNEQNKIIERVLKGF